MLRPLLLISVSLLASAMAAEPAKLLVFTRSQGFEHSMAKVGKDGVQGIARELTALGAQHDFTITVSKDGGEFTAEKLAKYDAFLFYTTGDLTKEGGDKQPPMSPEGKQAFLDAIKGGKGFVGVHCASDTFHSASGAHSYTVDAEVDPYVAMLGGEFIVHGAQQKVTALTTDPKFPGLPDPKDNFTALEEWYSLKHFAPDLHVLQVLDTTGMKGNMYQRGPYPVTWIHPYGKGRAFYTALGHRDDIWTNPAFRSLLASGLDYAFGRITVDDKPNLTVVAPKASEMPPLPPKK